ncbi:hypothetical protein UFOVP1625_31 [uncultured Caudovirales phage]|uniref:Uncharacterized protein n=1 Tax=uncultured Caudovirales phage TaxID=2100421 RepID=A0A6J5SY71_9CAUD|nr:hypothetical protein UFOVP1625_31 [uncultured Caudovirales phage]
MIDHGFTAQEIALLNQVLSQLTVNPAAPDSVDICMIVRSIQQKINPAQEPIEVEAANESALSE